ncbi:MAG: hypothetical protein V7746_04240 [Halioglobus sp.]
MAFTIGPETDKKTWYQAISLVSIIKAFIIFELTYLILVNAALQLPLTQTVVNLMRPDKFQVTWVNAWTWFPTRLYATGIAANGQTRSQQWQLQATEASASISLLPLVLKRVNLNDVRVTNVDYRQRPRLKADQDYSARLPYYPDITGREILPAETSRWKKKKPWKVNIRNLSASGQHSYWIYQFSGVGEGSFVVNLTAESAGGPFSLDGQAIDITLSEAYLNGTEEVFSRAKVSGKIGFSPFVPMENKGMRKLAFLMLDADIDLDTRSLEFLNLFTTELGNVFINGSGRAEGQLLYHHGNLLEGTRLSVFADDLRVSLMNLGISGNGRLQIASTSDALRPLRMSIDYNELEMTRDNDLEAFLVGSGLELVFDGSNHILPKQGASLNSLLKEPQRRTWGKNSQVSAIIESAKITDLSIINFYLPEHIPLKIKEGEAHLTANIQAEAQSMSGEVQLNSTDLQMQYDQQQMAGDLDMDLTINDGGIWGRRVDFSGSTVMLDDVVVAGDNEDFQQESWFAQLDFTRAQMIWHHPPQLDATAKINISDSRPVTAFFANQGFNQRWLSKAITLDEIQGTTQFKLMDNTLIVPHAHAISDKVELGAKVVFGNNRREGVIYARYEKLDVLLKMSGKKNNLDVIDARKTYVRYKLPQ